jgi:hypothetical protein
MKDERKYLIAGQDKDAKKLNFIKASLMMRNGRATVFIHKVELERCEGYNMESFFVDFKHQNVHLFDFKRKTKKQIEIAQSLFAEQSQSLALAYAEKLGVEIELEA